MEEEKNKDEMVFIALESGIEIETIRKVRIIRIKSDKYNLLILKDHCPIVGEINGSIMVEGEDKAKKIENIEGFYNFRRNEFNLIITGRKKVDNDEGESK